jgi:hypothetical protein
LRHRKRCANACIRTLSTDFTRCTKHRIWVESRQASCVNEKHVSKVIRQVYICLLFFISRVLLSVYWLYFLIPPLFSDCVILFKLVFLYLRLSTFPLSFRQSVYLADWPPVTPDFTPLPVGGLVLNHLMREKSVIAFLMAQVCAASFRGALCDFPWYELISLHSFSFTACG